MPPYLATAPATTSPTHLGYRRALDGMRGISILAVMAFHSGIPFARGGYLGVDIFFVLSGFLITSLLDEEWTLSGAISFSRFYARRALRLLPALFVCLSVCGILSLLFLPKQERLASNTGVLATLFYVANWARALNGDDSLGIFGHTWSLSIEEQFYVFWPLTFVLLYRLKLRRRTIMTILGIVIAAVTVYRAWLWSAGAPVHRLYNGSDTRADSLLIGCVAGLLFSWRILPNERIPAWLTRAAAMLGFIVMAVLGSSALYTAGYLYEGGLFLFALATGIVILELLTSPPALARSFCESRLLVWIGKLSYSLYLWYFPVAYLLLPVHWNRWLLLFLKFSVPFALASASYYFVEKPFLAMKHRFAAPIQQRQSTSSAS